MTYNERFIANESWYADNAGITIIDDTGLTYDDEPIVIGSTEEHGLVVCGWNEAGYNCVIIPLFPLLRFLKQNKPEIWEAIDE